MERCLNSFLGRILPTFSIVFFFFPAFLFSFNIKIASYNVENLFDMQYSGHEYKEYIPYKHGWNQQKLSKKLLNISEVICEINADIIGLQEVENRNILNKLQSSLRRVGCIYKYSAISHKKDSAIQVALLSKFPIKSKKEVIVNRALGYRNILRVKYIFNNKPLFIYVNHWKSKSSKESKRIISAKALKKDLQSLPKDSEYILLGDFNSDYDEYKHIEKKHNDTSGKTGINNILKTINFDREFIRPYSIRNSVFEHYNLWLELPNYKRWSHNFYGDKQALDAILLPYTLFDGKGIDYISNSFYVFKKNYLFHKKGYIFRWEYKNRHHQGRGYSDHLPIVASFSTKPFKKIRESTIRGSIKSLYSKNPLFPMLLKRVKVVSKEKKRVLIKDLNSKQTIYIYGVKDSLVLGKFYDIIVYNRKLYKGHYEIIDFEIKKGYDTPINKKD
ncbi:hypothetical protein MNB_SV-14-1172 [hydrothermal vent metagenome]|uniref:Endonuclease/exonuclease/phosphatase domain-containing protein n=1 Tax=hydrothermal vent metagenome TaxID=652676 RepID=A0A1W1C5L6_9ZZZZ